MISTSSLNHGGEPCYHDLPVSVQFVCSCAGYIAACATDEIGPRLRPRHRSQPSPAHLHLAASISVKQGISLHELPMIHFVDLGNRTVPNMPTMEFPPLVADG